MLGYRSTLVAMIAVSGLTVGHSSAVDAAPLEISQHPLLAQAVTPAPMSMLVMGRDRSLYNEAYNDASDLTGNGAPDVGYKPGEIDYYGYFDSFKCYTYGSGRFSPSSTTSDKTCSGAWSGDFLNYVTTARIDALRKVLYGGKRSTDEENLTVLERTYIPQDAHGWAKDYISIDHDGYDISQYTPLSVPSLNRSHVFASVSLTSNQDRPLLRVMQNFQSRNDTHQAGRKWEWASIESPVLGDRCFDGSDNNAPMCSDRSTNITDYTVRIEVCKNTLPEDNCHAYGDNLKPEGLLQRYGATGRIEFGLISGSYRKNTSGGVLRKAMGFLDDEIDEDTGIFTDVQGIIRTIDAFRIVGFTTNNNYHPGWPGAWFTDRPMNEGEMPDWGNPIGEMVYESVRYFAGLGAPTSDFDVSLTGGMEQVPVRLGGNLRLPVATWDDPYENRFSCTPASQLLISNPNTSYDTDQVPGTYFGSFSGDLPGFNASAEGAAIWSAEGSASGNRHFIGQSGGTFDGAPTVKTVTSLGNIRGIAPEEPTKLGGYYAASAARYGLRTDLQPDLDGMQNVQTFSVALASPLPKLEFPTNNGIVTLVPFGKVIQADNCPESLTLDPAQGAFQPMAQIVDFYIDEWANTHDDNNNNSLNGGRPYAKFRINYEDVEQGADHDMDSIVGYEVLVNSEGQIVINVAPEYVPSAGCLRMNFGYVISGVNTLSGNTADGLYLEVRGHSAGDTSGYFLNTPPGLLPGACAGSNPHESCSNVLPPSPFATFSGASRTFVPAGSQSATVLPDPLWYAAKYGAEANADLAPGETSDNYYLVTNASTLAEQLSEAFTRILSLAATSGLSSSSSRLVAGTKVYVASYNSDNWHGDLQTVDAITGNTLQSASEGLEANGFSERRIYSWDGNQGVVFDYSQSAIRDRVVPPLLPPGLTGEDLLAYLRGNMNIGEGVVRERESMLGDVVNSEPVHVGRSNEGWGRYDADYFDYIDDYKVNNRPDTVFVGANDGMLHAFRADTLEELFAYVPAAVHRNLHELADPNYSHRFYVDGKTVVADAKKSATEWGTVLVGTLGAGGRGIYALDVTQPQNFSAGNVLWEFTAEDDADLGYTFGEPAIGRLPSGRWVAVFGNGYNSQNLQAYLYIVDLWDGDLIQKIPVGNPGSNGLSGVTITGSVPDPLNIDRIYAGDLNGNMWRFDTDDGSVSAALGGNPLFTDPNGRAIIAAPDASSHPAGGNLVYFGTGKLIELSDRIDTTLNHFYAVRDLSDPVSSGELDEIVVTEGDVAGTRRFTPSGTAAKGWSLPLALGDNLGERVLSSPVVVAGRVIFRSFEPAEDPCQGGGLGRDYALMALSGSGAFADDQCLGCGSTVIVGPIGSLTPSVVYKPRAPYIPPSYDPEDPDDEEIPPEDGEIPCVGETCDEPVLRRDQWWGEIGFISADGTFRPILRLPEGRAAWREMGLDIN